MEKKKTIMEEIAIEKKEKRRLIYLFILGQRKDEVILR